MSNPVSASSTMQGYRVAAGEVQNQTGPLLPRFHPALARWPAARCLYLQPNTVGCVSLQSRGEDSESQEQSV